MKRNLRLGNTLAAGLCLVILSGTAHANDSELNLALPSGGGADAGKSRFLNVSPYTLALNGTPEQAAPSAAQPGNPATAEHTPAPFSRSNVHKYLGLGTLALVGLTAITAPDNEGNTNTQQRSGIHPTLGRATALMAAATVTTGVLAHWNDIHLEDGFTDPDNLHALLGTAGALAMLYAVSRAPGNGHPAMGIAGGVAMGAAIKLTW